MKNFTKEELATLLNNREYLNEVPDDMDMGRIAAENGLVIVFGASHDLCEFRGAINDEFGALEGATIPIDKYGIVINECDSDTCPYCAEIVKQAAKIKAKWCDGEIAWTFETDIPHATFDIIEDGEVFCRGIVFSLDDVDELQESRTGKP
jgi:hypothetical protein